MSAVPSFLAPPSWVNRDLVLYHGTLRPHALAIRSGIDPTRGSPLTDFGRGFYATTSRRQARSWAWQRAVDHDAKLPSGMPRATPVVIRFRVARDALARLQILTFVRGDFHAEDYWSLVHHCRSGGAGHARNSPPNPGRWYDVVVGPVAAVWRTRLTIANTDQYSFHTVRAARLLDRSPKRIETVG